jgi:hypothetical protein
MADAAGKTESAEIPVRVTTILWSLLSLIETLALVRVESIGRWNPVAAESKISFTKSPIMRDGKNLTLGGEQTLKGTLSRHIPFVSDEMVDTSGTTKEGKRWAQVHTFTLDGETVSKVAFLNATKEMLAAVNDEVLNL